MKRNILFGTMALLAGSLLAANAAPKDDVTAAAKKLAGAGNYSWKSTVDMGPNAPFTPGPTEGKTEKDGFTWLSMSFNDNTSEGVMKGGKVAVKTDEGWKTTEEGGGGGGFNPGTMIARRMQTLKVPAAEIEDLVSKTTDIKKDGDVYSGDLTEDGAKSLLTFGGGRRGGNPPPAPTGAKGSVKFWVKDGTVTKYEIKVQGKVSFGGEDRDMERTTTIEIKDVGTTKLDVPDDAKKKLL
jgi:hypothetical protein